MGTPATTEKRSLFGAPARYPGGWTEVGPGVHAWLQPNGDLGESNAGLVVGDGAAVLVDALWDERLTRRMLQGARELTDAPLTAAVLTHGDGDHCYGAHLLGEVETVATAAAAAQIAEERPAALAALQRAAAAGTAVARLPGAERALGDAAVVARYVARKFGPYRFAGLAPPPAPRRTFSGELELTAGGRTARLVEVGPAHSAGDLIVHVPDAAVVFAADVAFVGVTPIAWAGPIDNWRRALELVLSLEPAAIVPGHGPVCGAAELEALLRYWDWVEVASARGRAAGTGAYELARELLLAPEFAAAEWGGWDSPERLYVNLALIERTAAGRPLVRNPRDQLALFAGMARLDAELEARR
ncbi:MAG: MBL fold metallo-hydrolase [Solirubrobacterales bacterium]|nr:MBL fold metallo-hydrolase [Solirubrobacterales bacterium]